MSAQGLEQEKEGLTTQDRLWSNKEELFDCHSDSTEKQTQKEILGQCQVGRIQAWGGMYMTSCQDNKTSSWLYLEQNTPSIRSNPL